MHDGVLAVEVDAVDAYTLVHLRAETRRVLQQDLVELAPVDVEGVIPVDAGLIPLVEHDLGEPEVVR